MAPKILLLQDLLPVILCLIQRLVVNIFSLNMVWKRSLKGGLSCLMIVENGCVVTGLGVI